jgi:hypothetical protein
MLKKIKARLEPARDSSDRDTAHIRVVHWQKDESGIEREQAVRFHEVYWAPLTAGGAGLRSVLLWLGRQIFTPLAIVCSKWRSRPRLRRATLSNIYANWGKRSWSGDIGKDTLKLLLVYDNFEKYRARGDYAAGTYKEFKKYIRDSWAHRRPETTNRLLRLADIWHRAWIWQEWRTFFVILTLFLSVFLGACGALAMLATLTGVARFLRESMGDVQFWTTYEETDDKHKKRREILERGVAAMRNVLADPKCGRVVVVAHSLGTAIAMDVLLELGRYNRARAAKHQLSASLNLYKLDIFVTMGSPIDKIHYFFESHQGKCHRYNRVVEDVRGDIGTIPFSVGSGKSRRPWVHWMNFWDQGDPVSGPLESPTASRNIDLRVDNISVPTYRFPHPSSSHAGYFENREVMGSLFRAIFNGEFSFRPPAPVEDGERVDSADEPVFCGPGWILRRAIAYRGAMFGLPWLVLAYWITILVDTPAWLQVALLTTAALDAGILVLAAIANHFLGPIQPLSERRDEEFVPGDDGIEALS